MIMTMIIVFITSFKSSCSEPVYPLKVLARGIQETKIKSWEFLSSEEITHRCYMKMLSSAESNSAAYYIYLDRIDGDLLIRMKAQGEPLSCTQNQNLALLQDLRELYVNLPISQEQLLRNSQRRVWKEWLSRSEQGAVNPEVLRLILSLPRQPKFP